MNGRRTQAGLLAALLAACVATAAAHADSPPPEAPRAVIRLQIVANGSEAANMREALEQRLSRIGVEIAAATAATRPSLVDVVIDLSTGAGTPSVALTVGGTNAPICRRALNPEVSREVLIESAAEVAYTAIETRTRTDATPATTPPAATVASPADRAAARASDPIANDGANTLAARAQTEPPLPSFGIDGAALVDTRLRGFAGGDRAVVGGGGALTWGLRRQSPGFDLTLALAYLRPVATNDADPTNHLGILSARLTPALGAPVLRRVSVQVGPSLLVDLRRGDAPSFQAGPPPVMAADAPFSAIDLSVGAQARLAVAISPRTQLFAAGGVDYRLGTRGSFRTMPGPPRNGPGIPPEGPPFTTSPWQPSLTFGLAVTLTGRTPTPN